MHTWKATYRLDEYEELPCETQEFQLDTWILIDAAKLIEKEIGSRVTLIALERIL